ncbi:MAG: DNA alkylation repair protein [Solibacillus sp.]
MFIRYVADEAYKQFIRKLVDTNYPIVGVRVPILRQMAKELTKSGAWRAFLQEEPVYHEDVQLRAFVLGLVPVTVEERMQLLEQLFPYMDNWGVTDGLCSSLKETKKYMAAYWNWLQTLRDDPAPFTRRFIYVMYLTYYVTTDYREEVLAQLEQETTEHYYIQMAVAWAVSIAYIKAPNKVLPFLQNTTMPTWNYNKAIQKICESRQIDPQTKVILRAMKR